MAEKVQVVRAIAAGLGVSSASVAARVEACPVFAELAKYLGELLGLVGERVKLPTPIQGEKSVDAIPGLTVNDRGELNRLGVRTVAELAVLLGTGEVVLGERDAELRGVVGVLHSELVGQADGIVDAAGRLVDGGDGGDGDAGDDGAGGDGAGGEDVGEDGGDGE